MAKTSMSSTRFDQLKRESEEVAAVLTMPGWKLIEAEITQRMEQIKTILAENSIRTYTETTTNAISTISRKTTASTQIAENAGMYKMGQYVFELVDKIVNAPKEVMALERKGTITIEKAKADKSA